MKNAARLRVVVLTSATMAGCIALGCQGEPVAGVSGGGPTLDSQGGPVTLWDGGSCSATCSTPADSLRDVWKPAEAYPLLVGSWLICSGFADWRGYGAPADTIGVEFAPVETAGDGGMNGPEGAMYYLVEGPSGPVRGKGFPYQLSWNLVSSGPTTTIELVIHNGFGEIPTLFRYSSCPRQLELMLEYDGRHVLVPLP